MTDIEEKRRKEAWGRLTEAQKAQAEAELNDIYAWEMAESDKAMIQIRKEGRYLGGLDGHYPELIVIRKERNRRVRVLQEKYLKLAEE